MSLYDQLEQSVAQIVRELPHDMIHASAEDVLRMGRLSVRECAFLVAAYGLSEPKVVTRVVTDELQFKDLSGGGGR